MNCDQFEETSAVALGALRRARCERDDTSSRVSAPEAVSSAVGCVATSTRRWSAPEVRDGGDGDPGEMQA